MTDGSGAADSGFGSGLTKDVADVPQWTTAAGAISPEKDDILHAYAATYVSGGEQFLYFGQDRAPKPNGSTSMGFWFFQDQVGPDGAGGFTGEHQIGDVLVTSDMTNGGAVSIVNVFVWTATGGPGDTPGLQLISTSTDADCGDTPTPDTACGIANESPITVPWDYPADEVPANIFFEGGLNLSALFAGHALPCFSSFLANTRTSPSPTADLKDFVTGTIDTCGTITIHKDVVGGTSEQDFSYNATGTGLAGFQLDDDGDNANTLKDTKSFTGLTPGAYSVAEVSLAAGWTNTDLVCTQEGPGTSVVKSGGTAGRTATITLGLAGNVDCIYSNTFTKQTPTVGTTIHNAAHGTITSAPIGSTVHDSATVSGSGGFPAPTGNVSFTVYLGNATCTGTGTAAGSVALAAGVAHPSNDATVPVGGLSYKASYPGDSVYNSADGPCEPLTATKHDSTTATTIHDAAHGAITSAPIGTTVHDSATVSGNATGGTPTGNVSFTVYMGNTTCTGDGVSAGSVALSGGVAHPSATAVLPVGGLSYKATYAGSDIYNTSTGPCEPLAAGKLSSTTATTIHDANHGAITHAAIGSTVHDSATVTGSGAGGTPTGNVTFTVYMGNTTCTGEGASAGTVDLDGGVAHPSDTAAVPAGGLSYKATYNGSDVYNASTGDCEPLVGDKLDSTTATTIHNAAHGEITHAPIGSTVHDLATVSGSGAGGTPTGNVTFTVYMGNTTCTGEGASAGTVDLDDGTSHPSDTAVVPVGGLSYKATYNGSDVYNASTGACEPLVGDKLDSTTVTNIHNAAHETVTSVVAGTTVHDQATVSGGLGTPTGTVTFKWFTNGNCSGDAVATSDPFDLSGGSVDATTFAFATPSGRVGESQLPGDVLRRRHLQRVDGGMRAAELDVHASSASSASAPAAADRPGGDEGGHA